MKPLQPGGTIGIVSPASLADAQSIATFREMAAARGYATKVFGEDDETFGRMAARDDVRKANLVEAFHDHTVDAIICARGGYGSGRILDLLDPKTLPPKPFVGYSDVTNLLLHFNAHANTVQFHGPVVSDLTRKADPETLDWLFGALTGTRVSYTFDETRFCVLQRGTARGPLYGGNITIIDTLLGTDSIKIPDGAILVLEDVNEHLYAFDRSLVHLRRSGVFEQASAVLFSDLKLKDGEGADNSLGLPLREVLADHFQDFDGPVAYGVPCGHTLQQMTLPLGAQATLSVAKNRLSLSCDDFWSASAEPERNDTDNAPIQAKTQQMSCAPSQASRPLPGATALLV